MTPASSPSVDLVYPVRRGEPNTELRYSLRSVAANLPHRQVVIAGHLPRAFGNVLHLPTRQSNRIGALRNVVLNLEAAVESTEVSDPFYLFNDDFYVMVPHERIPYYNRGPLAEVLTLFRTKHHTGVYYRGLEQTYRILLGYGYPEPLAFNLHVPMLMHKEPLSLALDIANDLQHPEIRCLYGAIADIGGTYLEDPKRRIGKKQEGWEQWPLLSSNDDLKGSGILALLNDRFPGACRYELD